MKNQILSNLSDNELVLIKLQKGEKPTPFLSFHFFGENELSYSGHMYDIVRQENHGDITWYYCYSDDKETEVLANLNDYVKNQMENDPAKRRQRRGFQRLLLSLFPGVNQHYKPFDKFITSIRSTYSFDLKTWIRPPLTHPPQRT